MGEELEIIAKAAVNQPRDVVERMTKVLGEQKVAHLGAGIVLRLPLPSGSIRLSSRLTTQQLC
jgi:hypothetical protein